MPRTAITCYLVRDTDLHAVRGSDEIYCVGYCHDRTGYREARERAIEMSAAGRDLVLVEVVNGEELGQEDHYRGGLLVP